MTPFSEKKNASVQNWMMIAWVVRGCDKTVVHWENAFRTLGDVKCARQR